MTKRAIKHFTCAKCRTVNPDFLTFGARGKHYCLGHIPLLTRARLWLRERLGQ